MKLIVKKVNKDLPDLKPAHSGEWIDLYASETVTLKKGEFKIFPLGVCIKCPDGYEAIVVPRSSTFKKYHIIQANSMGVIDNAYCGNDDEWKFPAIALEDTVIPQGERFCQFRIQKIQPTLDIEYVDNMDSPSRGGFGSTGNGKLK